MSEHSKIEFATKCDSCGKHYNYLTSPMINDVLWKSISNEYIDESGYWHSQLFCLDCIEKKLGRSLTVDDISEYIDAPHNESIMEKLK